MYPILYFLPVPGLLVLGYTVWCAGWIGRQDVGEKKMAEVAHHIAQGATSFLRSAYRSMLIFVVLTCLVLLVLSTAVTTPMHPLIAFTFLLGAFTSAAAGWLGMKVATQANVRTTQAARTSLAQAFRIAFTGGKVMGMGVTGLATLGLSLLLLMLCYWLVPAGITTGDSYALVVILETLTGFSLGAEGMALFARVAGGIYTKAADVGADLVGKLEASIPEDDPRNPATIADNVGDNVGDIAGMGADLFGSYDLGSHGARE